MILNWVLGENARLQFNMIVECYSRESAAVLIHVNVINKILENIYIVLHGYFCIDLSMCPVNMYFP